MTIHIIQSQEYKHNQPHIFAYCVASNYTTSKQNYFGDLMYPMIRNFPNLMDYWRKATSSDSHRFFTVTDASITQDQFNQMVKLQNVINACEAIQKEYPKVYNPITWKHRRGKEYEQWNQRAQDSYAAMKEVSAYNKRYSDAGIYAQEELRELLINIKKSIQ